MDQRTKSQLRTKNYQLATARVAQQYPAIGLTAGDLAGVGPEIVAAAVQYFEAHPELLCGCKLEIIGGATPRHPGRPHREASQAAIASLEEAVQRCLTGEIAAVVTGPVNKHQLHQEGFSFPGQTEFFAARAGVENFAMLLTGGTLTVALVTAHVPLREVAALLSNDEIVRVGHLLVDFLKRRGIKSPRIAVAGLNPHAGEAGDLGDEEIRIIAPAVARLTSEHPQVAFTGPMSPDTIFWRAVSGEFDAVLCMYHDQGLIPLKLHAFHEGVNVTLGLPFVRTSPDHGTAYDLAGTGRARCDSMVAALRLAIELVSQKETEQ